MSVLLKQAPKKSKTLPVASAAKPTLQEVVEKDLADMSLEELADHYGSLEDQVLALKHNPVFTRYELALEELKKRLEQFEPDEIVKIEGAEWVVEAGACSLTPRKVADLAAVMAMVGTDTFLALAKLNVSDAEKYLTPEQVAKVITGGDTFTKNRKISPASYKGKATPVAAKTPVKAATPAKKAILPKVLAK